MGYLALYRKYRPLTFNDVYGQEEIVNILKNEIISNKISHAYLFCGPRGTGKTTIAKIIARTVNCTNLKDGIPCGKCDNCLNSFNNNDIVEIDAASNNGVDEIRELKDKVNLVPSNSKYKVYIIDEVHMLTISAFNALLKTLEEPPSHVIFILATTEVYKIPSTIISRCQKFNFSKLNDEIIVSRLKYISLKEKINVSNDSLYEIARLSDGGMRDAINLLDQAHSCVNGEITLKDIYNINGTISYDDIYKLMYSIKINDKTNIIEFSDNIENNGKDISRFIDEFIIFVKDCILYKNIGILSNIIIKNEKIKQICKDYDISDLYVFIDELNYIQNSIKNSVHKDIMFLVSILKFSDENFNNSKSNEIISREIKENISREIINGKSVSENKQVEKSPDINSNLKDLIINNALAIGDKKLLCLLKSKWNNIDEYLDSLEYSFVAGLLKDCSIVVASKKYFIFSSKLTSVIDRINFNKNLVENFIYKVFDLSVEIVCISNQEWEFYKEKYIKDIKQGKKYIEKPFIKGENKKTSIDELIDIIGDNMIEYK